MSTEYDAEVSNPEEVAKRPERPADLNGEHGLMWQMIDFVLDEMKVMREEMKEMKQEVGDLRSIITNSSLMVSLGLLTIAVAVAFT